jgi:hypothetical protein
VGDGERPIPPLNVRYLTAQLFVPTYCLFIVMRIWHFINGDDNITKQKKHHDEKQCDLFEQQETLPQTTTNIILPIFD